MKRRLFLTTLVALTMLAPVATRSDASSLLVTEHRSLTTGDFLRVEGTTAGVVTATVSANQVGPFGINTDTSGNVYVVNNGQTANNVDSVAQFTPSLAPNGFFVPPPAV